MKNAWLVFGGLLCLPLTATAQEPGAVGVSMGYPGAIGVVWHLSDGVAIRPDLTFNWQSTERVVGGLDQSSHAYGFGISGLFYARQRDNLRPYLSPRFGYSRNRSDVELSQSQTARTTSNAYQLGGAFGAQYALGTWFAVFGEAGLVYSWMDATSSSGLSLPGINSTSETKGKGLGTRTAVGVILYLK